MREYKFRGQRFDTDEWEYGDLGHYNEQIFIGVYDTEFGVPAYKRMVRPSTIGQYTGFKAKGKEIYEGDILQITIDDEVEVMTDVGVVKMSSCGGWIVEDKDSKYIDRLWEWTTEDIKIIGNIYENEDLLEVKYE